MTMQPAAPETGRADAGSRLTRPDISRWVFLTATVGHDPVEEGVDRKFSVDAPGRILVTRMEPGAYDYFMMYGQYADGTTFAVRFHDPLVNPDPEMDGLVLGDTAFLFVHRLERGEHGWEHAFYAFGNGEDTAKRLPDDAPCLACHTKRGKLHGTFVQFFAPLRERLQAVAADKQAAVEAVRTMFDALSDRDMARYRSVMAPGFYAFDMGKRMTADELTEVVEDAREAGMNFDWKVTEPKVRVQGPMAWVTYVNRGAMQRGDNRQALTWLESAVLRKDAGAWRIQFLHSTPMAEE